MRKGIILLRQCLSKAAKLVIVITPQIKEVITGMLLGDGWIGQPTTTGNAAFGVKQKDKDFVQLLWDIFHTIGIVGSLPSLKTTVLKATGKTYEAAAIGFSTFKLPVFAELFHQWYNILDGKSIKHLPSNIYELLTPVAIAYWVASDGHFILREGVVRISTDNFTLAEVELLQTILFNKFGIKSTRSHNGSGKEQYRIRISKASMPAFQSLIASHIPPMMAYRAGL